MVSPLLESLRTKLVYSTKHGHQLAADSREALALLPDASIDLVVTSPPFALLREKSYGNKDQAEYVAWLVEFGREVYRVLKPTGSLVIDLGGAYQRGRPVRSLYQFRVLLEFCDTLKFELAEEFYWHNPAKLPSPIEWVNKRKIRVKDSVNTVWWLSRTDAPKADVRRVLVPYSARMKKLLENPAAFYRPKERPSGHDVSASFAQDNGGAIPPNLLQFSNTESNSGYLRGCKALEREGHPARFPAELPDFFVRFLTEPGDVVVDIFSGSNTTGAVAEALGRTWLSIDERRDYAALSALRFLDGCDEPVLRRAVTDMEKGSSLDLEEVRRKAGLDRQGSLAV
jgi:DNA modification methylase